jgi:NAD(P)H-hydrate epimerase
MKVVSPKQMSDLESQAYKNGASESDFMEEAGSGVALIAQDYVERYNLDRVAILLCGKGNNGGDAYVAGIQLLHLDYEVFAIQPNEISDCSNLCKQSYERFMHEGGRSLENLDDLPISGVIIDGFFGTGFKGSVEDPYSSIIRQANLSHLPIISIDIPSGLNGETGIAEGEAIVATETVFLGLPKTGFFLNDGWNHVGKLRYVDFGMPKEYIDSCKTELIMLSEENVKLLLPEIKRNRNKYEAGYVVGLAGSPEMPGAAILSATSSLRGGAGIVRLFYPEGMQTLLLASPYELICTSYTADNLDEMLSHMNRASAIFIGPGLGQSEEVKAILRKILPLIEKPCVLDADALNIIAAEDIKLPKQTILTPHHGEMMRLLKSSGHPKLSTDFLKQCLDYAIKKQVTLVLKGGPTFILQANSPMFVNPTGDPGMATAGCGDVLTGLIAAILAQGSSPENAACLGVYLHGLAGEHAAEDMTSYGVCASDIIYRFPEAFKFLAN